MLEMKTIDIGGISYLTPVTGSDQWYWGSDYSHGDLYEAEEVFVSGDEIRCNRMVFVKYPEGIVIEPIKLQKGQYFGNAVFENNLLFILYVDFLKSKIIIKSFDPISFDTHTMAELDRTEDDSCYNLMLQTSPLFLSSDKNAGVFRILWPERSEFPVEETETIYSRKKEILISNVWYEDPDYHEELIIRKYPSGEVLERKRGTLMEMPDGQRWLLT